MTWEEATLGVAAVAVHDTGSGRQGGDGDAITSVEYDSRQAVAGSIFVAMRGGTTDGNRYIDTALARGAAGIITDSPDAFAALLRTHPQIPALLVAEGQGRAALARVSAAVYGHPEHRLHATGVTGTNGKTTTAFLIEALLQAAKRATILVGTIEFHVAGEVRPSAHTTPESRDLFALMADGVALGATELVMEVSSHALDQGRVAQVGFDVAVFTNLTRDHLDYHGTMEEYFAAKRLLFDGRRYPAPRVSVINADDPFAAELACAATEAGSQVVTYGIGNAAAVDWRAEDIVLTPGGVEFTLIARCGGLQRRAAVRAGLAGEVNVLNLLAALAAAEARGVGWEELMAAMPLLRPVPGRFEPVNAGQPFNVIVDYAHTDDALRNLTRLARQLLAGAGASGSRRIITVFGCGGDRDRTKRPKMGQAAGEGSDLVVVTSDNPRSESPEAIIAEIIPGVASTGVRFLVEPDRAAAIALALREAVAGDIVLIAGKGHEKQQILRDGPVHFDDFEVAAAALRQLGYGPGSTMHSSHVSAHEVAR